MEKNIKMTLETARKMYMDNDSVGVREWLLENFTQGELVGEVGKRWEECFEPGYYIEYCPEVGIKNGCNKEPLNRFKNQFRTQKQALSSLAFAQLSHIVAKYNDIAKCSDNEFWVVQQIEDQLMLTKTRIFHHLAFYNYSDCEASYKANNELWRQYWML